MRISTAEERGLQKFSRQESALRKYAEKFSIEYWKEFRDDSSGSSFDRPEWKKLEAGVIEGDTIVFKDISRFTREAENGYKTYMDLMEKGVELVFIDNPTISTQYVKEMISNAENLDTIPQLFVEFMVKILLMTELDRVEKERTVLCQRIKDGIASSEKKSGRKRGRIDKMTPELEHDLEIYLEDRSVLQVELMKKYHISRNTLKKYAEIIRKKFDK